ncbi:MAG TPA: hypothetical protein VIG80_13135 [Bacillaceae bacterium]
MSVGKKKSAQKDKITLKSFIGWLLLIVLTLYVWNVISAWLNNKEDFGQFLKFLTVDVLFIKFGAVILLVLGICIFFFCGYLILTKKAAKPKGLILPALLLTAFTTVPGYALGHDSMDYFADALSFTKGDVKKETVVITEFRIKRLKRGRIYHYTFNNGVKIDEMYEGKGFWDVHEGGTYKVRYLPRTKKLLSIEPADAANDSQ